MSRTTKKLILVLVISLLTNVARKKARLVFNFKALVFTINFFLLLKHILCIYYPLLFKKNKDNI